MFAQIVLLFLSSTMSAADDEGLHCGAYSLYVSLKALDVPIADYRELEAKLGPVGPAGYSMDRLASTARDYGLHVLGVISTPENLTRRARPFACIAVFRGNHFVNIADISDGTATIIDPPRQFKLPIDTLRGVWDGSALLLSRTPLVPEEALARTSHTLLITAILAAFALAAGTVVLSRRAWKER